MAITEFFTGSAPSDLLRAISAAKTDAEEWVENKYPKQAYPNRTERMDVQFCMTTDLGYEVVLRMEVNL